MPGAAVSRVIDEDLGSRERGVVCAVFRAWLNRGRSLP